MKREVVVVCRSELAPAFALASLRAITADSAADVKARLEDAGADGRVGVVLVQDDLLDALPPPVKRTLAKRAIPVVVPFPGPARAGAARGAEEYIVELLRQAIGYRVRLR